MQLDARLEAVASMIRAEKHCDIGTDHAYLLAALLRRGKIQQAIAVEKTAGPLANAQFALAGKNASVRLGDGLSVVLPGEVDSISLCGMGGELIVRILQRYPERVPPKVIVQPNTHPELVRRWAQATGYHLVDEGLVRGAMFYQIMCFERAPSGGGGVADPAYAGFNSPLLLDAAFIFGPHNLARSDRLLQEELRGQLTRLSALPTLNDQSQRLLEIVQVALDWSSTSR